MNTNTIEQKPQNKYLELIAVSVGHFTNDFYMTVIPPILFIFADSLGLTLTQQGLISFALLISASALQPVVGFFADKYAKPWFLIASIVWIAFWISISGLITNFYLLLAVLSIGALASAFYHPVGSTMAVNLSTKTKGTGISVFMTIGGFAASIAPLVVVPLVTNYGLHSMIYLFIPGLLIAWLMYKSKLHKADLSSKPAVQDVKEEVADQPKTKSKLGKYEAKWLSVLAAFATIRMFSQRTFVTFGMPLLLLKGTDVVTAGIVLSIALFARSGGTFIGGFLADRLGTKKVFFFSTVLATASTVLLILTSGIVAYIALAAIGFFFSMSNASNIVLAQDLIPHNASFATGIMMGLPATFGGVGLLVYSAVADSYGLIFATVILAITMILAVIMSAIIPEQFDNNRTIAKEYFDDENPVAME